MQRSIKAAALAALLALAALSVAPRAEAQQVGPIPGCVISGGTITCGSSSLTPSATPCTTTALSLQYNNAGAFGCVSGWTTNGSTALTGGASTTVAIGGATIGTNALAVTGTVNISGVATFANGAGAAPSITFAGAPTTGFSQSGNQILFSNNGVLQGYFGSNSFFTLSNAGVSIETNAGVLAFGASRDIFLARDAANTLAQRNSTTAQTLRVYGSFTDTSNYERAFITDNGSGTVTFGGQGAGTGVGVGVTIAAPDANGSISFQTVAATPWRILSTGHLIAPTDNTYDIGASAGTSPRAVYSATSLITAGYGMFGSRTALTLTAGAIGMSKITASASAPGAAGGKLELVCGTNAGTAKLVIAAGTSATTTLVVDNIGAGVSGC